MQRHLRIVYEPEDFAWITWDAPAMEAATAVALNAAATAASRVYQMAVVSELSFENTVLQVEAVFAVLSALSAKVDLLMNVSPAAGVRKAAQRAKEALDKAALEYAHDTRFYEILKKFAALGPTLARDEAKLLDDYLRAFRRAGLELAPEMQVQLRERQQQLLKLADEFGLTLNSSVDGIVLQPDRTRGLSENFLSGLKRDEAGNHIITTRYPDFLPFMMTAEDGDARKELADKYNRRGGEANLARLREALYLRSMNAVLLGYASHAAFAIEERMAGSSQRVEQFLLQLLPKFQKLWLREKAELLLLKSRDGAGEDRDLHYFEVAFWQEKLRQQRYGFSGEQLKAYFPLAHVLPEMMQIYSQLFGLRFAKLSGYPVWYEDVEMWQVSDAHSGELLSYFFLDLHPRSDKYGHMAEFAIVTGRSLPAGEYATPVASLVGNFPKITKTSPGLLAHTEVVTLFHEFGHVLHQNLAQTRFMSQSGTNVVRDFVEAPSQMLEYWVWQPEILLRLSRHYQTGEALPQAVLESVMDSKNFGTGWFICRQLVLGLLDFQLHSQPGQDPVSLYASLFQQILDIAPPPSQLFAAGFGHLMGGYDAGYYGYLWADVYAADMFSVFKQQGIMDPFTGQVYRKKILEAGSSRKELDSLQDFLGREPSADAFFAEMGL